jgi:phosphatidylinositol-3,4,5-trisphosphate 3-phosphatase/dual-specificity protein phosphatase PTEN
MHDLDLTYITPRIIALGLPASGIERMYRNPLSEVRDFLDGRHAGKYAIVNLCDERDYANADFPNAARVFRFPFADHHTCCMGALHAFCERVEHFFAANEEHVVAVHCKVSCPPCRGAVRPASPLGTLLHSPFVHAG